MDWDLGGYEYIAAQLVPASSAVLAYAGALSGVRLLDVGCGTGNAALSAAELGALATGVDPAPRLLEAGALEARRRGLAVSFLAGSAEGLPVESESADVVVSVFGLVFADDAPAAIEELARVTAEQGLILLSAWIPSGALFEVMGKRRRALAPSGPGPSPPPPFSWHDRAALEAAFAGHGFVAEQRVQELAFTAPSPAAFLEGELRNHPLWVQTRHELTAEALGELEREALAAFTDANEDPAGFRCTSRYAISRLTRP